MISKPSSWIVLVAFVAFVASVVLLSGCPKSPPMKAVTASLSVDRFEVVSERQFSSSRIVTDRIRVPGGWVYRSWDTYHIQTSMCYVPDSSAPVVER